MVNWIMKNGVKDFFLGLERIYGDKWTMNQVTPFIFRAKRHNYNGKDKKAEST